MTINPPSRALPTCFVSLPPTIASSLLRGEGIHALVLRLTQIGSTRRTIEPCVVSWAGDASGGSANLGIDSAFATSIGLEDGQAIRAEAIRHESHARDGVVTLVTRSVADYDAVSTTAEFAEGALLHQIRVLYPGLTFPLCLPGRRMVDLTVLSIGANGKAPDFLYVHPGVDVTVHPPAEPVHDDRSSNMTSLPSALRVFPLPLEFLDDYSSQLLASLDGDEVGRSSSVENYPVFVQTPVSGRRLPALLLSSSNFCVPRGHVYVPPHIWWELNLTMLDTLRFEAIASGVTRKATSDLCVMSISQNFPPVEADLKPPTIVYPGMLVGKAKFFIGYVNNESENASVLEACSTAEPSPVDEESESFDKLYSAEPASNHKAEERGVLPSVAAWSLDSGEALSCEVMVVEGPFLKNASEYRNMCTTWPPEEKSSTVLRALTCVRGETARKLLLQMVRHLSSHPTLGAHRLLLLRGGEGCGKTRVARACANILRYKSPFWRTVWVRWRAHDGEPLAASISRIRAAFRSAGGGSPSLLVFDDIDSVASVRSSKDLQSDASAGDRGGAASAYAVAKCITSCLEQNRSCVRLLLVAKSESVLDGELTAPGVVTCTELLGSLTLADRATILESMVQDVNFLDAGRHEDESAAAENRKGMEKIIDNVVSFCDGFSARDLKRVAVRATLLRRSDSTPQLHAGAVAKLLCNAANTTVPQARIGLGVQNRSADEEQGWGAVGGLLEAKASLRDTFDLPGRYPALFANAPVRIPSGVLLYGPPGTGKSLLATVASRACGLRSIAVKGPELLSKYIGESEAEVRRLFQRASTLSPCVVIFDELDAIAPRRGGETTGVADRVVNTLLTSLDGVEGLSKGVFVVATSSHPELIDPAILRPGRIDRWVPVNFPTAEERIEIFKCLWKGMKIDDDASCAAGLHDISVATSGMSGADIRGVLSDASLSAGNSGSISLKELMSLVSGARPSVSSLERERYAAVMSMFGRKQSQDPESTPFDGKHPVRVALH